MEMFWKVLISLSILIILGILVGIYIIYRSALKKKKNKEFIRQTVKQNIQSYKNRISTLKNLERDPIYLNGNLSILCDQLTLQYNKLSSLENKKEAATQNSIEQLTVQGEIEHLRRIINEFSRDVLMFYSEKYECDSKNLKKYHKYKDSLVNIEFNVSNYKKSDVYKKMSTMADEFRTFINNLCFNIHEEFAHDVEKHKYLHENKKLADEYNLMVKNIEFDIYSLNENEKKKAHNKLIELYKEHDAYVKTILLNLNNFKVD